MGSHEINNSPFVHGRGDTLCRGCKSSNLFSALDLGITPIANELLISPDDLIESFPLHLKICQECGLGQVADVVSPERIFRDYRYLSSISSTFLDHALGFVKEQVNRDSFGPEDWVLEIASNDGYLLKNFSKFGIKSIGVEPAENVAKLAKQLRIHTITEFFSAELALKIFQNHGYPKLIIANNVMAHVPDLIDFVKGLALLCGPNTKISIENPSLGNILIGMQFDTIYHEHYSYLSCTSVSRISQMHNLHLDKIELLSIHGGSTRYWLSRLKLGSKPDLSVLDLLSYEVSIGLINPESWSNFSKKVTAILQEFENWLTSQKKQGAKVFGYGAAAKASTILNSNMITAGSIASIADTSLEKQSRFMPPNGIPIISPLELFDQKPTDIVIFPWNIKHEISNYLFERLGTSARFWIVVPKLTEIKME
jgi:hypothetical protein